MKRVWTSVQLFIAFYKDPRNRKRKTPHVWLPKNATAWVTDKAVKDQEAFLDVKGEEGQRDVQIKFQPDQIVLRRDQGLDWSGIIVTDDRIRIFVNDHWIEVRGDGSVKRQAETAAVSDFTILDADGSLFHWTEDRSVAVSPSGAQVTITNESESITFTPDGIIKHGEV
ncbi:hypothetical protein [Celeribacter naphthalenivorans]|uniref:hypothetical protein n=1 Tax=Celeribacter naphthalenivorans TaxID=1614694 RepID=UPI001CFA714D|nr:hypothetical protein [Celeribacter naphthalenivorans]